VAPLEPWEKVFVDAETFPGTEHGQILCSECHGGNEDGGIDTAHTDLVARPSEGDAEVCYDCHFDEVNLVGQNLHFTQQGYWTVLEARGADPNHEGMQEMFGNHCASCHTSCGDCHVSQPANVGGGLLDGHMFTDNPPMTRTCTACHGSRVGNEFLGKNEGMQADVHFRQGRMTCIDCHEGAELHGEQVNDPDREPAAHRYEGVEGPQCETCHENVGSSQDEIDMHRMHGDAMSCQVCHSVSYINCNSCHVAVSEASGNPFFEVAESWFTFLIGRNPRQSDDRPYDYVPLRHVPIDPESFAYYGDNLLPDFDNQNTWRYATPHNIQRNTPQTESCLNCHENPDIFLTADKVAPEELQANLNVIVEEIPEAEK